MFGVDLMESPQVISLNPKYRLATAAKCMGQSSESAVIRELQQQGTDFH